MGEYVLETDRLTKRYKRHGGRLAVDGVSLHLKKGEIYGLIGKNGAGKTTLMKMVCGLIAPSGGSLRLFGSGALSAGRRRIGCMIEQPALYPDMSAEENLCCYAKLIGQSDTRQLRALLELVGLAGAGTKKARHFSLGMKQRLAIAVALLGRPELLILDEPINGLDPAGIKEIRELLLYLQQRGISVLISSHILGELALVAGCYGIMREGVLVEEVRTDELERRFKRRLTVLVDDTARAVAALRGALPADALRTGGGRLQIYAEANPALLNSVLVKNGVQVSGLFYEGDDMESYFVRQMGGQSA